MAPPTIGLLLLATSCNPRSDVINCDKARGPELALFTLGAVGTGLFLYSTIKGSADTKACKKLVQQAREQDASAAP